MVDAGGCQRAVALLRAMYVCAFWLPSYQEEE